MKHSKRYGNKIFCKYGNEGKGKLCLKGIFNGCSKKKKQELEEGLRKY